jgi:hypothetical protein
LLLGLWLAVAVAAVAVALLQAQADLVVAEHKTLLLAQLVEQARPAHLGKVTLAVTAQKMDQVRFMLVLVAVAVPVR